MHYLTPKAIPKDKLVDGATYLGHCRNSDRATWDAEAGVFRYIRKKFGFEFQEDIFHPDDDDVYDVFIPLQIINE